MKTDLSFCIFSPNIKDVLFVLPKICNLDNGLLVPMPISPLNVEIVNGEYVNELLDTLKSLLVLNISKYHNLLLLLSFREKFPNDIRFPE